MRPEIRRRFRTRASGAKAALAVLAAAVLLSGCEPRSDEEDAPGDTVALDHGAADTLDRAPDDADEPSADDERATPGEPPRDERATPEERPDEREGRDEEPSPAAPDTPAAEPDTGAEARGEEPTWLAVGRVAVGAYERNAARLLVRWAQAGRIAWSRAYVLDGGEVVAWRNANDPSPGQMTVFRIPRRARAWEATLVLEAYREPGGYADWPPRQTRLARRSVTLTVPPRGACSDYDGRPMECPPGTRR